MLVLSRIYIELRRTFFFPSNFPCHHPPAWLHAIQISVFETIVGASRTSSMKGHVKMHPGVNAPETRGWMKILPLELQLL